MSNDTNSARAAEIARRSHLLLEAKGVLDDLHKAKMTLGREQQMARNLFKGTKGKNPQAIEREAFNIMRRAARVTSRAIDRADQFQRLRTREE